jgi:methionine-R-sulfoxide reductase
LIKNTLLILFYFPFGLIAQEKEIKSDNYFDNLTLEEREIIVKKGTERAWSGSYLANTDKGMYVCKACNNPLFNSDSKFNSNCGWPSFDDEIDKAIIRKQDYSLGIKRIEICCSNCEGHLGHIFEGEGLTDKNIRHCVNSLSILFIPLY